MDELSERIRKLAESTAEQDWNDEGDWPITKLEWESVERFVREVCRSNPDAPMPFISPCGDGSVHLNWKRCDGARMRVELLKDQVVFKKKGDKSSTLVSKHDAFAVLDEFFRR